MKPCHEVCTVLYPSDRRPIGNNDDDGDNDDDDDGDGGLMW